MDGSMIFMRLADFHNYRVDFICLHYYGNYTGDSDNPSGAMRSMSIMISNVWNLYHKPIWLTEFALSYADTNSKELAAKELEFMKLSLPVLEKMTFIEHYFWFISFPVTNWQQTALENTNSNLNELGLYYKSFRSSLVVTTNY